MGAGGWLVAASGVGGIYPNLLVINLVLEKQGFEPLLCLTCKIMGSGQCMGVGDWDVLSIGLQGCIFNCCKRCCPGMSSFWSKWHEG